MTVSGHVIAVDERLCDACGRCLLACPDGNYDIVESKGKLVARRKSSKCKRCGACIRQCSAIAVSGVSAKVSHVEESRCDACEQCVLLCPEHVFEISEKKGKVFCRVINKAKCRGDRNCSFVCQKGAIRFK